MEDAGCLSRKMSPGTAQVHHDISALPLIAKSVGYRCLIELAEVYDVSHTCAHGDEVVHAQALPNKPNTMPLGTLAIPTTPSDRRFTLLLKPEFGHEMTWKESAIKVAWRCHSSRTSNCWQVQTQLNALGCLPTLA